MSPSRRLKLRVFRTVVFVAAGLFFLVPMGAMLEFSTRGVGANAARTLDSFVTIGKYPDLVAAIVASLELAVITSVGMVVLLVPTMIWVRLRLPGLSRTIEFICLLPLTIPAIVLVAGLAPVYVWISFYMDQAHRGAGDSILVLAFAYLVLVLPYAYRTLYAGLSAIDVKTLSEAARSLGAGWFTLMWRIIVPNMSVSLLNASLLSVAVVLGEFTIAQILNYVNVQVAIAQLGRANAGVSIAVAVGALAFTFLLLAVLSFVGGSRRGQSKPDVMDATWGQRT